MEIKIEKNTVRSLNIELKKEMKDTAVVEINGEAMIYINETEGNPTVHIYRNYMRKAKFRIVTHDDDGRIVHDVPAN